jgi:hypothetical protein
MPPVEEVYAECLKLRDEVAAQAEELARLAAQIEWFKKQLFGGGKSETQDAAQLRRNRPSNPMMIFFLVSAIL